MNEMLKQTLAKTLTRAAKILLLSLFTTSMIHMGCQEKIYKKMNKPAYIFDGRNILDSEKLESIGFKYIGLGR